MRSRRVARTPRNQSVVPAGLEHLHLPQSVARRAARPARDRLTRAIRRLREQRGSQELCHRSRWVDCCRCSGVVRRVTGEPFDCGRPDRLDVVEDTTACGRRERMRSGEGEEEGKDRVEVHCGSRMCGVSGSCPRRETRWWDGVGRGGLKRPGPAGEMSSSGSPERKREKGTSTEQAGVRYKDKPGL